MIYDLTLPIFPGMAVWPDDPPVEREAITSGHWRLSRWTLGSHTGTHVDAPAHSGAGPGTVDALDLDVLVGPCRVLHLPDVPIITAEVLQTQQLTGVERLLFKTRNAHTWRPGVTQVPETYVALDAAAARLLVALGVRLVGLDALSIATLAENDVVHEILLSAGVIIVEGLTLAEVPAGDYHLVCAPLKLQEADGAPARVMLVG